MKDRYRFVGPLYDWACKIYSGNQIHACKVSMLTHHQVSGKHLLFAGAGQGADAIHAVLMGAHVTIVDISPTMLERVEQKSARLDSEAQDRLNVVQGDILEFANDATYDMVVANFFLNVFDREKMLKIAKHLVSLLADQGDFVIGDFKPTSGALLTRMAQRIYWYSAVLTFNVIAGNAIHRIYDYEQIGQQLELKLVELNVFRVLGMQAYYSLRFRKRS